MRLIQAFRVFFRVLGDAAFAERVARAEVSGAAAAVVPEKRPEAAAPAPSPSPRPRRSDALTLLAVLQREGRLVDFLQEPIEGYPDAQIGAAVREVHRGSRAALERMFGLGPAVATPEGGTHRVEKGYDSSRLRLTGSGGAAVPCSGTVVHPGWEASRCELPEWTGSDAAARVVAPAEVEVR